MKFIDIHTHNNTNSDSVLSIINSYPTSINFSLPFSIGIHPWYIKEETINEEVLFIKEKLLLKECYAIGECGLDKLSDVDYAIQLAVFRKHIKLSEAHKKPLIVHCVKSFQDILRLKKELRPIRKWIIHGFHKNEQIASDLIKNGCFLSFGKSLITSTKLQEVFFKTPLNKIFLETDDSLIDIATIYQKASILKNITINELKINIHQNFNNIFIT
ncbi:TatD family hydrolase [Tenacibaculum sp. Bg11-29]|uniref:TatD family hydrolase n=1 Tax=Tenacibaculum sp. Bg11-29 TaxID=2058306 RepID=UPI0012FE9CDC|nr:TatD family hydrolase [Tenacibaculum sp. Bg11-29]